MIHFRFVVYALKTCILKFIAETTKISEEKRYIEYAKISIDFPKLYHAFVDNTGKIPILCYSIFYDSPEETFESCTQHKR